MADRRIGGRRAIRGRLALSVVATVGAVAATVLLVQVMRPTPEVPTSYDDSVAAEFVATCTDEAVNLGFAEPRAFCRCAYERISTSIPFERFEAVDEALARDAAAVPDEIRAIRSECFADTASVTPTTATPVVPSTTEAA